MSNGPVILLHVFRKIMLEINVNVFCSSNVGFTYAGVFIENRLKMKCMSLDMSIYSLN